MSSATIEAEVLQTCLQTEAEEQQSFEQLYYQLAIQGIQSAWRWSAIEDLRWPGVTHTNL